MGRDGKKTEMQPACRDYTLNMHKRLQKIGFKKRAPRAIRDIKRFAMSEMYTKVSEPQLLFDTTINVCYLGCESRHWLEPLHLEQRDQKRAPQSSRPCY